MVIQEMHYDFKMKWNKVDSEKNRNFLVPQIDWLLNEAANIEVALIAEPRLSARMSRLGFETSQRSTDDIRSIVVSSDDIVPVNNIVALPENYRHFLRGYANLTKGSCTTKARIYPRQHDDEFEESPFDSSSFEWRHINVLFNSQGLQVFPSDFIINNVSITYIRKMAYMHNAAAYGNGTYNLPSGEVLSGTVNCELPYQTHSEIVDIAVLLASGEVQASDYQLKLNKLNITQLI